MFLKSHLGKQLIVYFFVCFFMWAIHLGIISLVAFFHLLLKHNIRVISDWVTDKGWGLIILTKLLILYLIIQFISLKLNKLSSIKSYFRNGFFFPKTEVITAHIFLLLGVCGLTEIEFNRGVIIELDRFIFSVLGPFIFFSVDLFLSMILNIFYPLRSSREKLARLLIFPLIFYGATSLTFIYELGVSFKLYPLFLFLLYLGEWRRKNWALPFLSLALFVIPYYAFLGGDPIWGEIYSLFYATKKVSAFSFVLLVITALGYLEYKLKKHPEFIYFD